MWGSLLCVQYSRDLTSQDSFLLILVHKIHIYHITSFAQQFSLLHTLKHDLQKIQFHNHDLLKKVTRKWNLRECSFFCSLSIPIRVSMPFTKSYRHPNISHSQLRHKTRGSAQSIFFFILIPWFFPNPNITLLRGLKKRFLTHGSHSLSSPKIYDFPPQKNTWAASALPSIFGPQWSATK